MHRWSLLPPAGEGSVRMSLFSSIFVANYGKLNRPLGVFLSPGQQRSGYVCLEVVKVANYHQW